MQLQSSLMLTGHGLLANKHTTLLCLSPAEKQRNTK